MIHSPLTHLVHVIEKRSSRMMINISLRSNYGEVTEYPVAEVNARGTLPRTEYFSFVLVRDDARGDSEKLRITIDYSTSMAK